MIHTFFDHFGFSIVDNYESCNVFVQNPFNQ